MDYHSMKRKQLQALCKKHKIPANLSNLEMANRLTEFLKERENPVIEIESDDEVVSMKGKKVRFSPEIQLIEFTRSLGMKRKSRRNSVYCREGNSSVEIVERGEWNKATVSRRGKAMQTGESNLMQAEVKQTKRGVKSVKCIDGQKIAAADSFDDAELEEGDVVRSDRVMPLKGKMAVEGVKNASKRERKRAKCDDKASVSVNGHQEEIVNNHSRVTRSRAQKLTEAPAVEEKTGSKVVKKTGKVAAGRTETDGNRETSTVSLIKRGDEGVEKSASGSDERMKGNGKGLKEILVNKQIAEEHVSVEPQLLLRRSKRKANMVGESEMFATDARKNEDDEVKGLRKTSRLLSSDGSKVDAEISGIGVNQGRRAAEPRRSNRRKTLVESCLVEKENDAVGKNTRPRKNTSKCKPPGPLEKIAGDSNIQENKVMKRKGGHVSGGDVIKNNNDLDSGAQSSKGSSSVKVVSAAAMQKFVDERKQPHRLDHPNSHHGSSGTGESLFLDVQLSVSKDSESASNLCSKNIINDVELRETYKKKEDVSIADGVGSSCMNLTNGEDLVNSDTNAASKSAEQGTNSVSNDQNSTSNIVEVENDSLLLEIDVKDLIEQNITDMDKNDPEAQVHSQMEDSGYNNKINHQALVEGLNVSGEEGSASADSFLLGDQTDAGTDLKVAETEADEHVHPCLRVVGHHNDLDNLETSSNILDNNNEDTSQTFGEDGIFESCSMTRRHGDNVAEGDGTFFHKGRASELAEADEDGCLKDVEFSLNKLFDEEVRYGITPQERENFSGEHSVKDFNEQGMSHGSPSLALPTMCNSSGDHEANLSAEGGEIYNFKNKQSEWTEADESGCLKSHRKSSNSQETNHASTPYSVSETQEKQKSQLAKSNALANTNQRQGAWSNTSELTGNAVRFLKSSEENISQVLEGLSADEDDEEASTEAIISDVQSCLISKITAESLGDVKFQDSVETEHRHKNLLAMQTDACGKATHATSRQSWTETELQNLFGISDDDDHPELGDTFYQGSETTNMSMSRNKFTASNSDSLTKKQEKEMDGESSNECAETKNKNVVLPIGIDAEIYENEFKVLFATPVKNMTPCKIEEAYSHDRLLNGSVMSIKKCSDAMKGNVATESTSNKKTQDTAYEVENNSSTGASLSDNGGDDIYEEINEVESFELLNTSTRVLSEAEYDGCEALGTNYGIDKEVSAEAIISDVQSCLIRKITIESLGDVKFQDSVETEHRHKNLLAMQTDACGKATHATSRQSWTETGLQNLCGASDEDDHPVLGDTFYQGSETTNMSRSRNKLIASNSGILTEKQENEMEGESSNEFAETKNKNVVLPTRFDADVYENEFKVLFATPVKIMTPCKTEETYTDDRVLDGSVASIKECSDAMKENVATESTSNEMTQNVGCEVENNSSIGASLSDGGDDICEKINEVESFEMLNTSTRVLSEAEYDGCEALKDQLTQNKEEYLDENIPITKEDMEEHVIPLVQSCLNDEATNSPRDLYELESCPQKAHNKSEGEMTQSTTELSDADLQKFDVLENSHILTGCSLDGNILRETSIETSSDPEVAINGSSEKDVIEKGISPFLFLKASLDCEDIILESDDQYEAKKLNKEGNPKSSRDISDELHSNSEVAIQESVSIGCNSCKELDHLPSSDELESTCKEVKGMETATQSLHSTDAAAEHGSFVCGAVSGLLSSSTMHNMLVDTALGKSLSCNTSVDHKSENSQDVIDEEHSSPICGAVSSILSNSEGNLHQRDNGIKNLDVGKPVFNMSGGNNKKDIENAEENSTAEMVQFSIQELHFEENVVDFKNDEEIDNYSESTEENINSLSGTPNNLDKHEGCQDMLIETALGESLSCKFSVDHKSEQEMAQCSEAAVELSDADLQKFNISKNSQDIIEKGTYLLVSPKASTIYNELTQSTNIDDLNGAKICDESHINSEVAIWRSLSDSNHHQSEEAGLACCLELESTFVEAEETGTPTQDLNNIVAPIEHGSSVCGVVSSILSCLEMHLHQKDENSSIKNLDVGKHVFNMSIDNVKKDSEKADKNSTAEAIQSSIQELHFEENIKDFKNDTPSISNLPHTGHNEILKESDVADTIKEYVDSESSLTVMFENSSASLPSDIPVHTDERIATSKHEDNTSSVDCFDEEIQEQEEETLLTRPVDFLDEDSSATKPTVEKKGTTVEFESHKKIESEDWQSSSSKELGSIMRKNARTILIHGTPGKLLSMADMKENVPAQKISNAGDITAVRPAKRRALQDLQWK